MVSKPAGNRPTWDEVLSILSTPEATGASPHPSVAAAVEAAVARHQLQEKERLISVQRQNEHDKLLGLYRYSCTTLIDELKPLVDQFNQTFQHGKITYTDGPFYVFNLPMGRNISISFFAPYSFRDQNSKRGRNRCRLDWDRERTKCKSGALARRS